jgi:hypothetical protein
LKAAEKQSEPIAHVDCNTWGHVVRSGHKHLVLAAATASGLEGMRAIFANYRLGNIWPPGKATPIRPATSDLSQFHKEPTA